VSKEGSHFSAGRLQTCLITGLVGLVVFDLGMALIRAYLPLLAVLAALVLIVRVLWRLTR
jgi:hypothetical protein